MTCPQTHSLRQIWDSNTGLWMQSSALFATAFCSEKLPTGRALSLSITTSPVFQLPHPGLSMSSATLCPGHKSSRKQGCTPAAPPRTTVPALGNVPGSLNYTSGFQLSTPKVPPSNQNNQELIICRRWFNIKPVFIGRAIPFK